MIDLRALLHSPPPTTCWVIDDSLISVLRRDKKGSVLWAAEAAPPGVFEIGQVGLHAVDRRKLSAVLASLQPRIEGSGRAALVLPSGWTRSYLLDFDELPRNHGELDQVVRWRLKKLLPVPPADLRLFIDPVPHDSGSHPVVCMVGLDRALDTLEGAFSDVGVELGLVTSRAFALAQRPSRRPRLLVQQEAGFVVVVLTVDDQPLLVRTKPVAASRNPGETVRRELNLTLGYIREQLAVDGEIELQMSADDAKLEGEVEDWRASVEGLPRGPSALSPTFSQGGAADRLGRARIEPAYAVIAEVER
jgi:hypothetical protein